MAKPRKQEALHVVRQWSTSPVLYGSDSREKTPNPDYHPTIGLTSKGTFVDESGRPLDPKKVPDYVKAEARKTNLSITPRQIETQEVHMTDAMLGAGVPDTEPDPQVRAKRGRPRMVA